MHLHDALCADPLDHRRALPGADHLAGGGVRRRGIGLEASDRRRDRSRLVRVGGPLHIEGDYWAQLRSARVARAGQHSASPDWELLRTTVVTFYVRCCTAVTAQALTSRRKAVVEATIRVVGRRGYRAATVADLIAEAGVSRTTFYKHFADKHECFLAAYELVAKRVLDTVVEECDERRVGDGPRSWLEGVRAGVGSLIELLAGDPELARVAVVEVVMAGTEARQRQLELIERFARLLEGDGSTAVRTDPASTELPPSTGLMAAGAVAGLLFDEIQAGRTTELRRRLPDLLFALFVPYLGPREASAESN